MLTIRLPENIEQRLEALANKTGKTKTYYAREAILTYLNDMEDVYLAERRLKALKSGRSKTVKLSEVEALLDDD